MKEGQTYTFKQLEDFLVEWDNRGKCLKVLDIKNDERAYMHIFMGNFCGGWLSGDGILFYEDGEQHSAEPYSEFRIIEILVFSDKK